MLADFWGQQNGQAAPILFLTFMGVYANVLAHFLPITEQPIPHAQWLFLLLTPLLAWERVYNRVLLNPISLTDRGSHWDLGPILGILLEQEKKTSKSKNPLEFIKPLFSAVFRLPSMIFLSQMKRHFCHYRHTIAMYLVEASMSPSGCTVIPLVILLLSIRSKF